MADTTQRAAMQQAQQALERAKTWCSFELHKAFVRPECGAAITALRAALAEQAAEQAEPKGVWRCVGADDSMRRPEECDLVGGETDMPAAPAAEQAEPVAEVRDPHFGGSSYEASMLRELLARIHGDGGHYVAEHGLDKALESADRLVAEWRAAPPAPARQEWQPIETAPKTGAKIIVRYVNRNNKPRTVMARWLTDEQAEETDADGVGLKGGWYECIDNWDDYTEVAIHEGEPSLWMPLPAAPITAAPAGGGAA